MKSLLPVWKGMIARLFLTAALNIGAVITLVLGFRFPWYVTLTSNISFGLAAGIGLCDFIFGIVVLTKKLHDPTNLMVFRIFTAFTGVWMLFSLVEIVCINVYLPAAVDVIAFFSSHLWYREI